MWKSLKPATAIALALGLGGCASLESPTSLYSRSPDRDAPKVFPNKADIDNQMRLADASLKAGNEAAAISMYRRLAREYPLSLKPRIALGEALLAANAPQEAARAFEGALNLKGDSAQALVGLGRVELALHQPAKALENFDRAAKADAKNTAARNGRAVALDQLGRHEEAQAVYLDLLAKDPSNLRVRNNYALSLALAGKYDDSADILAGLAAAPDAGARIRQNLALVYGLSGNDGQAAHVARMDLDEDAVHNNLEYYQRLRHAGSSAKGAALVNPARDTLSLSERAPAPAAKSAEGQSEPPRVEEAAPTQPARQQRVEYRAPKNAKSNGIFADVSHEPREVAPLPARALETGAKQERVVTSGAKPDGIRTAEAKPQSPKPEAVAVAAREPESRPLEAANARSTDVKAGAAASAPVKLVESEGSSRTEAGETQEAQVATGKRSAAVPAVGSAPAGVPAPVGAPKPLSDPARANTESVSSGRPAERDAKAEAWAALEAAPQAPIYKKKSSKPAAHGPRASNGIQAGISEMPADIKPSNTAAEGTKSVETKPAASVTSPKAPAAAPKPETTPSGTTAETNAVKSAPLKAEPLAAAVKRAVPAVPPVSSAGEGVSGSIGPAMKLRPSSGSALQAPAVPKLTFRDRKADISRPAAVPDKG